MLKRFLSDESANYAIAMAVMVLPLLLSIGFAVDYSRGLTAKNHLQGLADAASLALASSSQKDQDKLRELADQFIAANLRANHVGAVEIASFEVDNDQVDIGLKGKIDTFFMGLANIHTLDVQASALAERAVTGSVEVALVLDNTDSMTVDDKIGTLKKAATNLVEQLHENDDAMVRIGLVPYGEQINVGMANRKASWISVPEDKTTKKSGGPCYTVSTKAGACKKKAPVTTCTKEKDGVMVQEQCGGNCIEPGDPIPITPYEVCPKDQVTTLKWHGCVGSRVSKSKPVLNDLSPSIKYPGYITKDPKCLTEILPLTDDEHAINAAIAAMKTYRPGYTPQTYIPAGVIWGVNALSPSQPFTEGAAYDPANAKPRKVIVLMTDGLNTRRVVPGTGDYASANAKQRIDTNTDTTTICDYAKGQEIEIFTVAFKVEDSAAKAMLQGCASDQSHYYDASDPDKLLAAFSGIAQSLSQVRLAR
jgi:Flp pilus assembly protein TadG